MNCVAAVKAAKQYQGEGVKVIVTILCDQGLKYLSKFYSQEYLDAHNIEFKPLSKYDNLDFIK